VDEAIDMELKAVELNLEEHKKGPRYTLSRLYGLQGNIEQVLEWAKQSIQQLPNPRIFITLRSRGRFGPVWYYLSTQLHEGRIPPERLIRWCEDVLHTPGLHPSYRLRTQYLLVDIYDFMSDKAKVEAMLASLGAPRESDWMVIGPFDASEENLFPETPPFVLCTNLETPRVGALNKEIRWEPWEDETSLDGLLNIVGVLNKKYYGKIFEKGHGAHFPIPAIVYSCIYVYTPTSVDAQVRTGSSLMKVWLNDNPLPVLEVNTRKTFIFDDELSNVSLAAGLNRFLVATVSGTFSFSLRFRITDSDGNAIPELKYVSMKEVLESR